RLLARISISFWERLMRVPTGWKERIRWIFLLGLTLLPSAGCNPPPKGRTEQGTPLFLTDEKEYRDDHERLHFVPPPKWSMQARSMAAPKHEDEDRLLVKYKNLVQGTTTSWMTLRVATMPAELSLADCLLKKKAADQTLVGKAEEITIKGRPAARITVKEQVEGYPFIRETVAMRRGERVYFLSGIYYEKDKDSPKLIRESVETCELD